MTEKNIQVGTLGVFLATVLIGMAPSLARADKHLPNCTNNTAGRTMEFKSIKNLDVVSVVYSNDSTADPRPTFTYNYLIEGVRSDDAGQAVIFGTLIESIAKIKNKKTGEFRESFILDRDTTIEIGFKGAEDDKFAIHGTIYKTNQKNDVIDLLDGAKGALYRGPLNGGKSTRDFPLAPGLTCDGMVDYMKMIAQSHPHR